MCMYDIYKLGDTMLKDAGNDGYNCIKLIEAMSSLRVAELAREFRDLIPEFPSYRNHIYGSVEELSRRFPTIQTLNDCIQKLETPEIVLTVYGAFRHWGHPYIDYLAGLKKVHDQVTMSKKYR